MVEVSVVVPIFNGESFLTDLLKSLDSQTFPNFEVIFVDDGSTDDTLTQLHKLLMMYPERNWKIIEKSHSGLASTRNVGILNAQGNWIAFLDSDDRWAPNKLRNQMDAQKSLNYVAIVSRTVGFLDKQRINQPHNTHISAQGPRDLLTRSFVVYGGGSNILLHKSIFDRIGMFDTDLFFAEDFDFWLRVASVSSIVEIPEVDVEINLRHSSMQRQPTASTRLGILSSLYVVYLKWIQEYPIEVTQKIYELTVEALHVSLKNIRLSEAFRIFQLFMKLKSDNEFLLVDNTKRLTLFGLLNNQCRYSLPRVLRKVNLFK